MIYLAQSDTTAGFLSQNEQEINKIKSRNNNTKCIITVANFNVLKNFTRIPNKHKNFIRKAKKTSFIYPNKTCLRVIHNQRHSDWIKHTFDGAWAYSSSANEHGKKFNIYWASKKADIICDKNLLQEGEASKIIALSKTIKKKIR